MKPIRISIPAPSKKLVFCNFFDGIPDQVEDVDSDLVSSHSINEIGGRVNAALYEASLGVAYAQTSNASVAVFYNSKTGEGYITDGGIKDDFDFDNKDENGDTVKNEGRLLYDDLITRGFKCYGTISCEMWRIEVADAKTKFSPRNDKVKIKINAKNVNFEIYDRAEPINAHFWATDEVASATQPIKKLRGNRIIKGNPNGMFKKDWVTTSFEQGDQLDALYEKYVDMLNPNHEEHVYNTTLYTGDFADCSPSYDWHAPLITERPHFADFRREVLAVYGIDADTTENYAVEIRASEYFSFKRIRLDKEEIEKIKAEIRS